MLITHLDRSESIEYLKDAHVPSSALKLWFRELGEPLIPKNYYDKAIDVWQPLNLNALLSQSRRTGVPSSLLPSSEHCRS
jgi:hypothetical protein